MKKFLEKIYGEYNDFINFACKYTLNKFPNKYAFITKKQKYNLQIIIIEMIYILKSGISYENYRGPINAKTLNKHILFFAKHDIFGNVYEIMYNKYISINTYSKLKYQSIDTSFIINKNGKQNLGRNKYCKNKNCYKLSFLVDKNRIPDQVILYNGNKNDAKIGKHNILKSKTNKYNQKIKPYILADKIYDTAEFRSVCIKNNYRPIIDYNKRNTKDKSKIKRLTKDEKKIYKKRIIVENSFCLIKKFRKIQLIYDSYMSTFISFIKLATCIMISKYI